MAKRATRKRSKQPAGNEQPATQEQAPQQAEPVKVDEPAFVPADPFADVAPPSIPQVMQSLESSVKSLHEDLKNAQQRMRNCEDAQAYSVAASRLGEAIAEGQKFADIVSVCADAARAAEAAIASVEADRERVKQAKRLTYKTRATITNTRADHDDPTRVNTQAPNLTFHSRDEAIKAWQTGGRCHNAVVGAGYDGEFAVTGLVLIDGDGNEEAIYGPSTTPE